MVSSRALSGYILKDQINHKIGGHIPYPVIISVQFRPEKVGI